METGKMVRNWMDQVAPDLMWKVSFKQLSFIWKAFIFWFALLMMNPLFKLKELGEMGMNIVLCNSSCHSKLWIRVHWKGTLQSIPHCRLAHQKANYLTDKNGQWLCYTNFYDAHFSHWSKNNFQNWAVSFPLNICQLKLDTHGTRGLRELYVYYV